MSDDAYLDKLAALPGEQLAGKGTLLGIALRQREALRSLTEERDASEEYRLRERANHESTLALVNSLTARVGELEAALDAARDDLGAVISHKPGTPGLGFPSLEALIGSAVSRAEIAKERLDAVRDNEQLGAETK